MQDNWTDDSLADKGWQKMELLLDQELPVRNRKRRPLFLLFFVTGALAILFLGWNIIDFTVDKETNVFPVEVPLLPGSAYGMTSQDNTEDCEEEASSFVESNRPLQPAFYPKTSITKKSTVFDKTIAVAPIRTLDFKPFSSKEDYFSLPNPDLLLSVQADQSDPADFPLLSNDLNLLLDYTSSNDSLIAMEVKPSKGVNYLEGGLVMSHPGHVDGATFTWNRGLKVGQKADWRIDLGIGWKYQNVNLREQMTVQESASPSMDLDTPSGGFSQNQSRNAVDSLLRSQELNGIHYLTLPVTVSYQLKSRWLFRTGLSADYLLAENFFPDNEDDYTSSPQTQIEDLLTPNALQLTFHGGVFYRLNPRTSLGYQYDYGLIPFLKNEQQHRFFRQHRFSFQFYLK